MKTKNLDRHRMQARSSMMTDSSPADGTPSGGQVPVVLLVEEEAETRALLRGVLSEGCHLLEVAEGGKALDLARKTLPDLVIADLAMPAGEGVTLCQQLMRDEETNHIPIIVLTDGHSEEDQIRALETGAVAHLSKPVALPAFRLLISNLIEHHRRLQQRLNRFGTVAAGESPRSSADRQFLKRAISIAQLYMGEAGLNADSLAHAMAMSRSSLYRKIHEATGQSVNLFVRDLRIRRAAQLLRNNQMSISEVAYQVGFHEPSYFSRCFREQFGQSPSDYRNQLQSKFKGASLYEGDTSGQG